MMYLELFWEFFKIGLFSLGGGLATLPFLYNLAVTHPHWIAAHDIADMLAISESTPGPIGINMATYAGFQALGPLGGFVATMGLVCPSILIILIIARFLGQFDQNKYVKHAFYGLRAAVVGLITFAGLKLFSVTMLDGSHLRLAESILFVVMLVLILFFKKIHPLFWIIAGAVIALLLQFPL